MPASDPMTRDDFALRAIAEEARTPAYTVGLMLLAANISLPVLLTGGQLGVTRGFDGTVTASLWGGLILAGLTGSCAYAGARSRLSTYVLIVRAFGDDGGKLISLLLAVCAIGWFGVVLRLFADTVGRLVQAALLLWSIFGAVLMAYSPLIGFRALTKLSNVMLPAKLFLLICAIWAALRQHGGDMPPSAPATALLDDRSATSFVVGGWVVGAVIAPDFARYARSVIGGAVSSALAIGVGYPLILVASSIPAIATGNTDLLDTITRLHLGAAALAIILLSSWTNGALNLYSGSLMLSVVFRDRRRAVLIWGAATAGTILGVAGIAGRLIPYLTMLSLFVPPIAGVYLPRYMLDERRGTLLASRRWHANAMVAFVVGVAAAIGLELTGFALTGVGAVDSLLSSAGSYLALELARSRGSGPRARKDTRPPL